MHRLKENKWQVPTPKDLTIHSGTYRTIQWYVDGHEMCSKIRVGVPNQADRFIRGKF